MVVFLALAFVVPVLVSFATDLAEFALVSVDFPLVVFTAGLVELALVLGVFALTAFATGLVEVALDFEATAFLAGTLLTLAFVGEDFFTVVFLVVVVLLGLGMSVRGVLIR